MKRTIAKIEKIDPLGITSYKIVAEIKIKRKRKSKPKENES